MKLFSWFRLPWSPKGPPGGLSCHQVVELVTDYLEDALPPAERRRFETHLAGCPHCTEYLAQMRETIRLTGQVTPEDLTPRMRSELTDVFRQWRAEEADGTAR